MVYGLMREMTDGKKLSLQEDVEGALKNLLTKKELRHIRIDYLRNGILRARVDSSVWAYHFNLRKRQLLPGLQKAVASVKDIQFWIGEIS